MNGAFFEAVCLSNVQRVRYSIPSIPINMKIEVRDKLRRLKKKGYSPENIIVHPFAITYLNFSQHSHVLHKYAAIFRYVSE